MTPTVEVLLATFNGARFLRAQIDSVFKQQAVNLRILARDDGSQDDTTSILAAYAAAHPDRFRLLPAGAPTGESKRNFHLLLLASTEDYVAFCDQDDVWLPHKLQTTLGQMHQLEVALGKATPLLVSTDLQVVDEKLAPIAPSLWQQNGLANTLHPPLGQLLSENTVTGCTALLNRALVDRLTSIPASALMHDHWAALVAASTGAIAGISDATVLYRQHVGNVVGASKKSSSLQKMRRLLGAQAAIDRAHQYQQDRGQAHALLELHGDAMDAGKRETTEAFIYLQDMSRMKRIRTMQRYGLWRSGSARKLTAIADILRD